MISSWECLTIQPFSVESFDVFCFGHILYEMSTGKPFYFKTDSYTSNDVLSAAYNTAVIEGREVLPAQLPDSLSKYMYHLYVSLSMYHL